MINQPKHRIVFLLLILFITSCTVEKNITKNQSLTKEKILLYLEPGRVYRIRDLNEKPIKFKVTAVESEIIKGNIKSIFRSLPFEMSADDILIHNNSIYAVEFSKEKTTILKHIIIISLVLGLILIFGYSYCAGCII